MNLIIDLSPLAAALEEAGIKTNEFANAAVGRVSEQLAQRWRDSVKRAPGIRPDERSEYVGSIDWSFDGNASAVVQSNFKNARQIEEGRPAYDMKQMLQTSVRTKMSKEGKRYLTIPIRHNTPGSGVNAPAMPPAIYAHAQKLNMSRITGSFMGANANGRLVPRNMYRWGAGNNDPMARLKSGLVPRLQPHHKTDQYAGMVRMPTEDKKSQYLTLRTMSESSTGWIQKAKPGLFILRDVATFMQADTGNILNELLAEMR